MNWSPSRIWCEIDRTSGSLRLFCLTSWLRTEQNEKSYAYLAMSCASCDEARPTLYRHAEEQDGIAALHDLQTVAVGSGGMDSAENLCSRLYNTTVDTDFRDMLNGVYNIGIKILNLPKFSIDLLLKLFLLRCVRNHTECLHYQAEEKECAVPSVSFVDAYHKLSSAYGRRHGPAGQDSESAHVAQYTSTQVRCWGCGKPGVKKGNGHHCSNPHGESYKGKGGKGKGGKGKGNPLGAPGEWGSKTERNR